MTRIQPIITGVLVAAWFEVLRLRPDWVWLLSAFMVVLLIGTVFVVFRGNIFDPLFYALTAIPLLLVGSAVAFYLLLDSILVMRSLSIGVGFFVWYFAVAVETYLHRVRSYQPFSVQNITNYLVLITVFCFSAALAGFRIFLGTNLPTLLIGAGMIAAVCTFVGFVISRVPIRPSVGFAAVVALLFTETTLVVLYLPTSFFVNAGLMTISYYIVYNLARLQVLDQLRVAVLRRYVLISAGMVFFLLLTAQWT